MWPQIAQPRTSDETQPRDGPRDESNSIGSVEPVASDGRCAL